MAKAQRDAPPAINPAGCVLYARLAISGDKESLRSLAKLRKEIGEKEWAEVKKQLAQLHIRRTEREHLLQQIDAS